ncbi:MAG: phosphatase [Clostridia bacterium]|nr:phosphatase [Clostridia bacterium]
MKILTDVHTHTNASSHAYSTLYENMYAAKKRGLELVAMTNHAPSIIDAPHIWHFMYFKALPRVIEGVRLMCGVEANILDKNASLDMPESVLSDMEVVIASIHPPTYKEERGGDHTETWLNVIDNEYVDILGHTGSPDYPFDIDAVVRRAKEKNKCIEINNHSFISRPQNIEICREIALACKKYETPVVVNSDAHFMDRIGEVSKATEMLEEIGFPQKLIMNLTAERFIEYISKKKDRVFKFDE